MPQATALLNLMKKNSIDKLTSLKKQYKTLLNSVLLAVEFSVVIIKTLAVSQALKFLMV
jgi:hypothetical protein